jgi:hypothetical protein
VDVRRVARWIAWLVDLVNCAGDLLICVGYCLLTRPETVLET